MIELVNVYLDVDELVLIRRDAAGNRTEERRRVTWDCFVRADRMPDTLLHKVEASAHVASVRREGEYIRIGWRSPQARRSISMIGEDEKSGAVSPFFRAGVEVLEGDVHPVRRFLVDEQVKLQRPKRVYLDIESDSRVSFARAKDGHARVLCFTLRDEKNALVKRCVLESDDDEAERRLLREFWDGIDPFDQVVAYSSRRGDTFDFLVMRNRSRRLNVRHRDARVFLWLDHCMAFLKMNLQVAGSGDEKASYKLQDVATSIVGHGKNDFDASRTWQAWLVSEPSSNPCPGCGVVHPDKSPRQCMLEYNDQDTALLPAIESETGYLELVMSIAEACGILPDSSAVNALTQIDTYLLRSGRKSGMHFPSAFRMDTDEDEEQFRGAYVMRPKWRGVVTDVHVCDFSRLYPSVIITWNMSPETKVRGAPINGPIAEGHCRTPTTAITFRTGAPGILPAFLIEIAKLRKVWNDRKASLPPGTPEWHAADRMSNAYKVLMNAAYGVIGSRWGRYFDKEIAESVTQTGVFLIQRVIAEIEARWKGAVGYGDTDSAMCRGPGEEEFRAFVKGLNADVFPVIVRERGCSTNDIALAYEKQFSRVVFGVDADALRKGDEDAGIAKRYAGRYAHYKGKRAELDSEPEIKGLEFKRGDTAKLARRLQERVIRMILGDWIPHPVCSGCRAKIIDPPKPAPKFKACPVCNAARTFDPPVTSVEDYRRLIARARDYVLTGPLRRDEVVIAQGLNRPLNAYASKTKGDGSQGAEPTHVAVARVLEQRGADVSEGTKIQYVVIDASDGVKAIPADDWKLGDPFDRFHLWEKKVWPPTGRLLISAFPDVSWKDFDRVRPQWRAPLKGGAAEGQGALPFDVAPAAKRTDVADVLGDDGGHGTMPVVARQVRKRSATAPYVVTMTSEQLGGRCEELKVLLAQYPGQRPVTLKVITLDAARVACAEVELAIPMQVAGSIELATAIERFAAASSRA
jgi:DNA polymerase elongation subunit (family B)